MKTTAELEAAIHEIRSDVMSEYIPPAKITQLVKGALRKAFPDSTFRVSTRHGIQVEWHDDGPTVEQVQNALLGAKLATAEHGRDGRPWLNGPGCMSYRLDRFNPAKREADKADLERRMQEAQAQRLREEEAVRKAVTAKRTAVATDTRPIVSEPLSDPAVFAVFEELRQRAEVDVSISSEAERQRRPSWAPPLIIEGELLEACRELGYLSADAKPIVRLWTQFADPKKKSAALREQRSNHPLAGIACRGFELHVGSERGRSRALRRWRPQVHRPLLRRLPINLRRTKRHQPARQGGKRHHVSAHQGLAAGFKR